MTERTTPITVHLTDEQMDSFETHPVKRSIWVRDNILADLADAIRAQRPRPIAVGDRVTVIGSGTYFGQPHRPPPELEQLTVEAIKDGKAWVWHNGHHRGVYPLYKLTRINDEAKP